MHDQFTRRRNDHRARLAQVPFPVNRVVEQIIKDRDQKGSRFTGTCLCLADSVITHKGMRQDATLNRRTKLKAQRIDAPLHRCIEIQRLKLYLFSGRGSSGLKRFALRGGVFLHAILHDGSRKK